MRVAPYSNASPVSSPIMRERGCMYYTPWIAIILMIIIAAVIGVWIAFSQDAYNLTMDGTHLLGVTVSDADKIEPAIIASAVVFFFFLVAVLIVTFLRSFVEAHHDAGGLTGTGAAVYLFFNAGLSTAWYLLTLWAVVVFIGCVTWAAYIYIMRGSCDFYVTNWSKYEPAFYVASLRAACPGTCLNLDVYSFISTDFADNCICDVIILTAAYKKFDDALGKLTPILITGGILVAAAIGLLVNVCCAFSHTKRERDYIQRFNKQQFSLF